MFTANVQLLSTPFRAPRLAHGGAFTDDSSYLVGWTTSEVSSRSTVWVVFVSRVETQFRWGCGSEVMGV